MGLWCGWRHGVGPYVWISCWGDIRSLYLGA
jgi:hypothetical protein